MDESLRYDARDKHRLAFRALTGPRGQQMGRLLGADVTRIEACVNCHSVPGRDVETQQFARESDGVTCVACHGAYAEWVGLHQGASRRWRSLDRKAKERQFGMTDLWDPVRRAETCASCHIGDHAGGKVITHAMYAAGHPPLPGFEAATFCDAQPRHWELLREKTPARRERLGRRDADPFEQTRLVVLGGLVELRESMRLLADQAGADRPEPLGTTWPDFARFDCYACHHELRRGEGASWRQLRRRDGTPGRPAAPDWPLGLARLGIETADSPRAASRGADIDDALATLRESLKARPFGDPATLVPAARKVAARADSAIRALQQDSNAFDADKTRALLDRLCKMAETPTDYDSARQIAWAFRVIYRESVPEDRQDPAIGRELAGLETELALDLPPARTQAPIETSLPDRLKKAAEFDPAPFQAHFARIAERLAAPSLPTARTADR
jgi:hypothetical protein